MTRNEFYQKALLQIASNSAFGSGRGCCVDYISWTKRIHEAAATLTDIAQKNSSFDKHKPP